ncbi:tRNA uridine-5-carboxymethylaminomethyl(34) synthesis GTPase MnmE [Roseiconus nitratireducens]|uniref:tRNA modification GTPase MnmE n=1 Tax=Roseiconus nitratireducens TaxID=2605748 RepID=A0A5M6D5G2_9BACT|nr:GTPase [Roseiconus nitratireducens]KAA5542747.1 tRNA uridine-5-carboxymethylaminomethyl(34) synthesis GTPase MnmE [Roseiconus nitratireducens]
MASTTAIDVDDTIVAIASSPAAAHRGAVRMSGSDVLTIAGRLGIHPENQRGASRVETSIDLGSPLGVIPVRALVWPTGRSYTGQPAVEVHTFGSLPILQAVVRRATESGARAARPGEFTLRAFLAGRLDLTQAEAVLGVIDADHRGALDHALRQLAGNLSRPLEFLRGQLLDLLADVEAGLDFVDEDIEFISEPELLQRLGAILSAVSASREQLAGRGGGKSETVIALRGLPNAGKSRLINVLAGREAAIVADQAGTTRDVVRVSTQIAGHDVVLVDTAGIEGDADDGLSGGDDLSGGDVLRELSQQAQRQADRAGRDADVRLWCVDHSRDDWHQTFAAMQQLAADRRASVRDIWIATKCDLAGDAPGADWIATSAVTGRGISDLVETLGNLLSARDSAESTSVLGTAARCQGSLIAAESAIAAAIEHAELGEGQEYVASELRIASASLGEVTGAVYTDDILDRVFSRFCIGK